MGHAEISIYAWAMRKSEFLITSANDDFTNFFKGIEIYGLFFYFSRLTFKDKSDYEESGTKTFDRMAFR